MPCNCDGYPELPDSRDTTIGELKSEVMCLTGFLCAALNHIAAPLDAEKTKLELDVIQEIHRCGDIYAWFQSHCDQDKKRVQSIVDGLSDHEVNILKGILNEAAQTQV